MHVGTVPGNLVERYDPRVATPGTHALGPDDGTLEIHTFREGLAQRIGHDLIIEVGQWQASVEVSQDGAIAAVTLEADSRSLAVREGRNGLKALSDSDRADILGTINTKILRGAPIEFRSSSVEHDGGRLAVRGDLTLAGTTRPASFALDVSAHGRVAATLTVVQSEWGISPYRGLLGALKVRDAVEIMLDVAVP